MMISYLIMVIEMIEHGAPNCLRDKRKKSVILESKTNFVRYDEVTMSEEKKNGEVAKLVTFLGASTYKSVKYRYKDQGEPAT